MVSTNIKKYDGGFVFLPPGFLMPKNPSGQTPLESKPDEYAHSGDKPVKAIPVDSDGPVNEAYMMDPQTWKGEFKFNWRGIKRSDISEISEKRNIFKYL